MIKKCATGVNIMQKIIFVIGFVLFVASCATLDKSATSFEIQEEDKFVYEAWADAIYPLEEKEAEDYRISFLKEYLADNNLCPNGYEISRRQPILKDKALLGPSYRIFYYGKCRD
jgi:hypothetical protein